MVCVSVLEWNRWIQRQAFFYNTLRLIHIILILHKHYFYDWKFKDISPSLHFFLQKAKGEMSIKKSSFFFSFYSPPPREKIGKILESFENVISLIKWNQILKKKFKEVYIFFFFQLFYFIYELVWSLKNKGAYLLVVWNGKKIKEGPSLLQICPVKSKRIGWCWRENTFQIIFVVGR